jgi:YidC/Oxa1 family membrane protein insertase
VDNRRLILAFLLSAIVVVLWQFFFAPSPPVDQPTTPAPPIEAPVPFEGTSEERREESEKLHELPAEQAARAEEVVLENARFLARFSNVGAQLVSLQLKEHLDREGKPLELVKQRLRYPYPFGLVDADLSPLPLNEALFVIERGQDGEGHQSVEFRYRGGAGAARKRFVLSPAEHFAVEIDVSGFSDWGLILGPGLRNENREELESKLSQRRFSYLTGADGKADLHSLEARKTKEASVVAGSGLRWLGFEDTYFLTVLVPSSAIRQVTVVPYRLRSTENGNELVGLAEATGDDEDLPRSLLAVVQPASQQFAANAYWGGKHYDRLVATGWGLEQTVRWGFFRVLVRPLQILLDWIHDRLVQNYGWAIVLTTVFLKLLLFPLTHKSYVSMQRLQKLNPKMEAIRQKFRPRLKDKQGRPNLEMQRKMNEELQELFRTEGVNPASGCLPILLQLPVFFAFYSLLGAAIELWNAPWILWIRDLSSPDPYYAIPIVMGLTQLLQQKMTPAPMNPSQRIIMTTMPIWFTIFSFTFPSGLVLYWLTNNVLTILQQGGYNELKKRGYFGATGSDESTGIAAARERR